MSVEIISSEEAFKLAKHNKLSKYPKPDRDKNRLFPFPTPYTEASFQIKEQSRLFTMGSCFAREVDKALTKNGYNVISRVGELPLSIKDNFNPDSFYNKYTVHSILNEINWACNDNYNPQNALLNIGEDKWIDPQLGGDSFIATLNEMLDFRKAFNNTIKQVLNADVVILTLGLVESWYDKVSGLYLNATPPMKFAKRNPERFELRVLDYDDIFIALQKIIELLNQHNQDVKVLITVSPVPLLTTFREQDILVANSYSKSVQRAAVEKFVKNNTNVDYFPSYEFVNLGDPNKNWAHDYRHVSSTLVNRIMANVMHNYIGSEKTKAALISSEIHAHYLEKDFLSVIRISENVPLESLELEALYRVGLCYKKSNNFEKAFMIFNICIKKDMSHQFSLQNAITMAKKIHKKEEFNTLLHTHQHIFPQENDFRNNFNK